MKGLTLRQPWAWFVAHGPKRVENRPWDRVPAQVATARRLVGQRIAIHAGQGFDASAEAWLDGAGLARWARLAPSRARAAPRGAVVAVVTLDAVIPPSVDLASPWRATGAWGLVFRDVDPLDTPVPCRGALGFWELPSDVGGAVGA
jgi:hypothetical protein